MKNDYPRFEKSHESSVQRQASVQLLEIIAIEFLDKAKDTQREREYLATMAKKAASCAGIFRKEREREK